MKRFLLKSLLYSLPILVPVIIFCCFINPYISGDIGPLGYVTFPKGYAEGISITNKVVNCEYNFADYQENGILTIGDSFSQTGNREISYNYFMAEYWEGKVYNLSQDRYSNPFNRFIYLSRTQKMPKIVVIESVERYLIERLNGITLNLHAEEMIARKKVDTTRVESHSEKKSILEKTQEWLKREMHIKGYENPIYAAKLSKPLFSCQDMENDLYFYYEDVSRMNPHDTLVYSALEKLDSLFNYADSINVDLYVLIAADKYEVYQDYIVNNKYKNQDLLDEIEKSYTNSRLINSKDTLHKMLKEGVLDLYWSNNTHWSPVGSNAVAKQVLRTINN